MGSSQHSVKIHPLPRGEEPGKSSKISWGLSCLLLFWPPSRLYFLRSLILFRTIQCQTISRNSLNKIGSDTSPAVPDGWSHIRLKGLNLPSAHLERTEIGKNEYHLKKPGLSVEMSPFLYFTTNQMGKRSKSPGLKKLTKCVLLIPNLEEVE